MRRVLIACSLLVHGAMPVAAVPGNGRGGGNKGCDSESLAAARQLLEACKCDEGPHGKYVSCTSRALHVAFKNDAISRACRRLVRRGAARSTCGKSGFVACCRPNKAGPAACSVRREGECDAPACASPRPSCLDACSETGCAASPSGAFVAGR